MSERRPKRPGDPAQLTKLIVDIATGEADDEVNSTDKNKDAAAIERGP
jgi:hypothetical protein